MYFNRRVAGLGVEQVLTAPRSPWQSPYVERVVGSIRRECLDHSAKSGTAAFVAGPCIWTRRLAKWRCRASRAWTAQQIVDAFPWDTAPRLFRVLFVFIVLRHDRRRIVHFNVTDHLSAECHKTQRGSKGFAGTYFAAPSASHAFIGRPVPRLCSTRAKAPMTTLCFPIPKARASTFSSSSPKSSPRFQSLENTAFTILALRFQVAGFPKGAWAQLFLSAARFFGEKLGLGLGLALHPVGDNENAT